MKDFIYILVIYCTLIILFHNIFIQKCNFLHINFKYKNIYIYKNYPYGIIGNLYL